MFMSAATPSLDADRNTMTARAAEDKAAMQVKDVKNSVCFVARFEGIVEAKKGGAAEVASAGQAAPASGGAAGGGESKKDPPAKLRVTPIDIDVLVANANETTAGYYRVTGPDSIDLACWNEPKKIKAVKETFDKAHQAVMDAKTTPAGVTPELQEALNKAELALQEVTSIQGWVPLKNNETFFVSWFALGEEKQLGKGNVVLVKGCSGTVSIGKKDGKKYTGANCAKIMSKGSTESALVTNSRYMDLFQQPVRRGSSTIKYGEQFVLLFMDYVRSPEDTAAGRGPVVQRMLTNSRDETDWKTRPKEKEEQKLIGNWTMWQKQEEVPASSLHDLGYPKGDFLITATSIEGLWEDETQKNTLRVGFGINDADTFAKMMSCNPVPALVIGAVNPKKVAETEKAGNTHMLPMYINKAHFLLREYLITNCASVSFAWVRRFFSVKPSFEDEDVFIQRENVKRKCLLNANNTISTPEGLIYFAGEKVVNISAFSGNIGHLKKQGCQWRVMIAVHLDGEERRRLAGADNATAEKTLDRAEGGLFPLPEGYKRILYAVVPPTPEENTSVVAAFDSWKDRRAQKEAAKSHASVAGVHPLPLSNATDQAVKDEHQETGQIPMETDHDEEAAQRAAEEAALQAAEEAALQAAEEETATRARQAEEEALLAQAAAEEQAIAAAAAQEKAVRVQKKRDRPAPSPSRALSPGSAPEGKAAPEAKPAPKKKAAPSKNV